MTSSHSPEISEWHLGYYIMTFVSGASIRYRCSKKCSQALGDVSQRCATRSNRPLGANIFKKKHNKQNGDVWKLEHFLRMFETRTSRDKREFFAPRAIFDQGAMAGDAYKEQTEQG